MRFETSVVVNRPIDEVWAFMLDPFNMPRIGGGRLAFRVTPPGPLGLGSTFQGRMVILGFETRVSGAFTEWDPPRAFAISLTGAGIQSASFRQTNEATADGTKIVRMIETEPRPAFRPLWWIIGPWFRRREDAAIQNIKRLLEAERG